MPLNIFYSLFPSLEEKHLDKYFLEITFYTPQDYELRAYNKKHQTHHLGHHKCYLPIILKVRNRFEAMEIAHEIVKHLYSKDCFVEQNKLSETPLDDKLIESAVGVSFVKFRNADVNGKINLKTLTPVLNSVNKKFNQRDDEFNFSVTHLTKRQKYDAYEYSIVFEKISYED